LLTTGLIGNIVLLIGKVVLGIIAGILAVILGIFKLVGNIVATVFGTIFKIISLPCQPCMKAQPDHSPLGIKPEHSVADIRRANTATVATSYWSISGSNTICARTLFVPRNRR
jgi:hypothetical protein